MQVREDLGWPIVMTPFAQYIVTQATLNVMAGQRYKQVADEIVDLLRGDFGPLPGPVDQDLMDRAMATKRANSRSRATTAVTLEELRARFGHAPVRRGPAAARGDAGRADGRHGRRAGPIHPRRRRPGAGHAGRAAVRLLLLGRPQGGTRLTLERTPATESDVRERSARDRRARGWVFDVDGCLMRTAARRRRRRRALPRRRRAGGSAQGRRPAGRALHQRLREAPGRYAAHLRSLGFDVPTRSSSLPAAPPPTTSRPTTPAPGPGPGRRRVAPLTSLGMEVLDPRCRRARRRRRGRRHRQLQHRSRSTPPAWRSTPGPRCT